MTSKNKSGFFDFDETNTGSFENSNVINKLIDTPIQNFIDFNIKKSELFICDSTYSTLKSLFSNISNQPILINGLPQSGKGCTIFHMLKYLPYYNPGVKKKYKFNDLRFFNSYNQNEYQKILYYQNCYYIDMKLFLNVEKNIPINFLLTKFGNYKSLDGNCKIIIIKNINLLNMNNQKQLANIIERYQANHLFILTSSQLSNIYNKIKSLSIRVRFPYLPKNRFISIFKKNFKHLINNYDSKLIENLYLIYQQNNYNLSNTLHQIYCLFEENKIDKKFFKSKINYISLQTLIISNIINKYCTQNSISVLEDLRKSLYLLNSLNVSLISVVKDTVNLLLTSQISNLKKDKIIKLGSTYSTDILKADRDIIHFENFFIHIIQIITLEES
jgi:DNA polymerase III delta prime subunit